MNSSYWNYIIGKFEKRANMIYCFVEYPGAKHEDKM